jgi:hypothetical protein
MAKVSTGAGGEYGEKRKEEEPIPSLELLQGMTLKEFRSSGLVVVAFCPVLKEAVVWAADDTPTSFLAMDEKGRVVYRGEELRLLTLLGPEDLVAYHALRIAVGEVSVESIGMAPPDEVTNETTNETTKKKGAAA